MGPLLLTHANMRARGLHLLTGGRGGDWAVWWGVRVMVVFGSREYAGHPPTRAFGGGACVCVQVDPEGGRDARRRCMHVNLIKSSNLGHEREFLFAPYSVFTVRSHPCARTHTHTNARSRAAQRGAGPAGHLPTRARLRVRADTRARTHTYERTLERIRARERLTCTHAYARTHERERA